MLKRFCLQKAVRKGGRAGAEEAGKVRSNSGSSVLGKRSISSSLSAAPSSFLNGLDVR